MKHLITILLILFSAHSFGQILKNTSLNLNSGGVIHDIVYDSYYDAYIVVGDFTSINGQPRNNLAFIDANTMNVMTYNPIASIDGEIRTVEFYSSIPLYSTFPPNPNNPDGRRYYLYLGGNFETINGNTVEYLARLSATHMYGIQPQGTKAPYNVNFTWTIDGIYPAYIADYGVYDLHLDADTLVVAGQFYSQKAYYPNGQRNFLNAYDVTSGVNEGWLNWFPANNQVYDNNPIFSVDKFDGDYYLTSTDEVFRYTPQGVNTTPSFDYFETNGSPIPDVRHVGFGASSSGDVAMFTTYDPHTNGYSVEMDSLNHNNTISPNVSVWYAVDFENYKDYVYSCESATLSDLTTRKINSGFTLTIESTFTLNSNWQPLSMNTFTPERQAESLFRQNNRLFLSGSNLTTVDGTSRTGLAVFCLEPRNAEPFTNFDNLACEGDSSFYTIPQADFADGYRWSYSGTGAQYRTIGSSAWNPLSTVILSGANTNTIEIHFPIGATSGVLSVEPYSVCNTTSDYQFAQGQSGSITVNANPDLTTQPTATLNCYSDTAQIVAQSTNPNAQFVWSYNGILDTTDIVLIYEDTASSIYQGVYSVIVTDTMTGCFNSGTTDFSVDTVATQISQSAPFTSPTEWTCLTDSMVISGNQPNYIITWEDQANLGVFHADPYTIDSLPVGLLTIHGIEISNGCPTFADYGGIIDNQEYADGVVQGYATLDSLIDDSINCFLPSLNLACEPSAAYSGVASSYWVESGTQNLNLTVADSVGMDVFNTKTYLFETTHNTSGCVNTQPFTVQFNVDDPFVPAMADQMINCSQTSVELNHALSGSSFAEGWLDSFGTQTGNPITQADSVGEYYYQVQGTNGCFNTDTVLVTQSQEMWLDMPTDTLICRGQSVSITAVPINNTEPPTYSWSTGSSSASETAIGGIDSLLYVTISTPSGCTGTDSTTISVTDTVSAFIDPIAGCTDGNLQVTGIAGGLPPFQYSIDGSTWQNTTLFSGLSFGNYTIVVQDDLGCEYSFDQALNGSAITIDMNFLASTYNEQGDTILVSNTTVFNGLDSLKWEYPLTADVQIENDSILQLSMDTEGWYDITLLGYLDSVCEYSLTKAVYFGGLAPSFDSLYVEYSIVSDSIYPNPTNGTFTISVEFGKAQNYSIIVTNAMGQPIPTMNVSGQGKFINQIMSFPSGAASQTYYINLIADYDAKRIAIMLN